MGRHHSLKEIKDMLEACHGAVYISAEKLDMSPSALYTRIRKSPDLRAVCDLFRGRLIDAAELKLEQAVKEGESWAISFVLRTLGRDRGYQDKLEVTQSGRLTVELEPKVGPQLDRAIQRVLGGLAGGGETSAFSQGDRLPRGFQAPR